MKFSLVTNGCHIDKQRAELLSYASWVRISIDAGRHETYSKIRGVSKNHWYKALGTIAQLADLIRKNKTSCTLGVGFVVTKENWREVVQATELARQTGAHNIRISAMFSTEEAAYFSEFREQASLECRHASAMATDTFKVFNMFEDRTHDLDDGPPDYQSCGYQHFTTYIGGDLNVYRCCNTAYNQRGLVGSIKDQSFKQLWESQARINDYQLFDARGCERCQFNGKNRSIAKIIDEMPQHVEFV